MRSVLVGGALLIALYVGVQKTSANAVAGAGGVVVGLLQRLLSANVAGLPNVSHAAPAAAIPQAPGPLGPVPLNPGTSGPARVPSPVTV